MRICSRVIRHRTNQKLSKQRSAGFAERLAARQNARSPSPPNGFAQVKHAPSNLFGTRDRALLLLGFAGAFRRSELVGLDVSDLKEMPAGLQVHIRGSKTDQERTGQI